MAQFESTTYAAKVAAAANSGKYLTDADLVSGKETTMQSRLLIPADAAAASTFLLDFLPAGATLIPGKCSVSGAAAGAGTIAIGFDAVAKGLANDAVAAAPAAIAPATAYNAAGHKVFGGSIGNVPAVPYRRTILLTTAGAALTEGVELFFNFTYVHSGS